MRLASAGLPSTTARHGAVTAWPPGYLLGPALSMPMPALLSPHRQAFRLVARLVACPGPEVPCQEPTPLDWLMQKVEPSTRVTVPGSPGITGASPADQGVVTAGRFRSGLTSPGR